MRVLFIPTRPTHTMTKCYYELGSMDAAGRLFLQERHGADYQRLSRACILDMLFKFPKQYFSQLFILYLRDRMTRPYNTIPQI